MKWWGWILIIIAIILFLIIGIIAFVMPQALISDSFCGKRTSEESQNDCCSNLHKGEPSVECIGSWEFLEGIDSCRFFCASRISCPDGAKACEDGTIVMRNRDNECFFDECPGLNPTECNGLSEKECYTKPQCRAINSNPCTGANTNPCAVGPGDIHFLRCESVKVL